MNFEHCSVCVKKFLSDESAMMHYNHKHPEEMQMCSECGMLVSNARTMAYHFKTKHSDELPLHLKSSRSAGFKNEMFNLFNKKQCPICKQTFKSVIESHCHFVEEHDMKFDLCSVCLKGFRTDSALLTHWGQHHEHLKFVEFEASTKTKVNYIEYN